MKENQRLYYLLGIILMIWSVFYYCLLLTPYATAHHESPEAASTALAVPPAPLQVWNEQFIYPPPPAIVASSFSPALEEKKAFDLQIITETISFQTFHLEDDSLDKGRILTLQEGREGVRELLFRIGYAGEREIYRELVGETVLVEPLDTVVAVGTKPRPPLAIASREKGTMPYREEGIASWYGAEFQGSRTTSGELYDKNELTAAHRTLPFNTLVKVTYLRTGREVVVRINDRGPHVKGRIIDISRAAAEEIGLRSHGVGKVRIEVIK